MRSRRNCSSDGAERTDDGRAFHARAAVTGKAGLITQEGEESAVCAERCWSSAHQHTESRPHHSAVLRQLHWLPATCAQAWLGSRVVSVLDSGAEGPGFKSQPRRCRVTVLGKLLTPIVPPFTKQRNLTAAGVTAGVTKSNGSPPSGF